MRLFLTILGCTIAGAMSAYAGGLADAIVETGPQVMSPDDQGSLPGWVVPVAIAGLLIGAAVLANDSDGDGGAS